MKHIILSLLLLTGCNYPSTKEYAESRKECESVGLVVMAGTFGKFCCSKAYTYLCIAEPRQEASK